jgi:hypothetical protein
MTGSPPYGPKTNALINVRWTGWDESKMISAERRLGSAGIHDYSDCMGILE